jgi:hypothetical protein
MHILCPALPKICIKQNVWWLLGGCYLFCVSGNTGVGMKLAKRLVEALECDTSKPLYVWDASLTGFAVKGLPSGLKKYLVKYRTQDGGRSAGQRWLVIGTHGQIILEQARK